MLIIYNKTHLYFNINIVIIALKYSFDFQPGHTKGLLIFHLYLGHGQKKHDEFNGIWYYNSLFEDYKILSDLVSFRFSVFPNSRTIEPVHRLMVGRGH